MGIAANGVNTVFLCGFDGREHLWPDGGGGDICNSVSQSRSVQVRGAQCSVEECWRVRVKSADRGRRR
jgi:hypothetical protein